jgi:leader peptidase (prepilin peptidase)/N-methyltransferase
VVVITVVAVTVTDLRDRRVPIRVIVPAMVATAATLAAAALVLGQPWRLWWAAAGAAGFSGLLLLIHLARPHGLGRGDVRLAVVLGGALGWLVPPWPDALLLVAWALAVASGLGLAQAAVSSLLGRTPGPGAGPGPARAPGGRGRPWSQIAVPFAPALSGATIVVVLLADVLLS